MSEQDLIDAIMDERGHTWNHRVVWIDDCLGVCEVYYTPGGNIEMWTEHMKPIGETFEELDKELKMFRRALKHPILKQVGEDEFARLVEVE